MAARVGLKPGAARMIDALEGAHRRWLSAVELQHIANVTAGGTYSSYLSAIRHRGILEESRGQGVRLGEVVYWGDNA